ncbi:hypothetical protein ACFLT5_03260 [Chloroflexota bacterium]
MGSSAGLIRALEHGRIIPWKHQRIPYEETIDPDGVATEFVRCIDVTPSGIVIKVTRTALPE